MVPSIGDLGSVEEGQVEGDEPHLAAAGLDAADYGLVFL
jgi:hypothetical protein